VCHICGLAIYIEKYINAKNKIYGNSNISPCKNIKFKKSFEIFKNINTISLPR
jgi:hypothetical protein